MTDYLAHFHPEDLIKRMSAGELDVQVFSSWGISKKTFYSWKKEHIEFKEAAEQGEAAWEAAWLKKGLQYMEDDRDKPYRYWNQVLATKVPEYSQKAIAAQMTINNVQVNLLDQKSPQELATYIQSKMDKFKDLGIIEAEFQLLEDKRDIDDTAKE